MKSGSKSLLQILGRVFLSLLVFLLAVQLVMTLFPKQRRGDLGLVIDAATRLRTHQPLYYESEYLPHTKSPLATIAFVPMSFLPTPWLDRIWDLSIILAILYLCWWCSHAAFLGDRARTVIAASVLTAFNPLNSEIAFGQFNLFLLLAAIAATSARSQSRGLVAGAAFAFSICFKPTQILLLPWVWKFAVQRKSILWGGLICAGVLSGAYILGFGFEKLISDHRIWLSKTAAITPYHLGRPDNYGLPSAFFILGGPGSAWSLFQLVGFLSAIGVCAFTRDRFQALALSGVLVILCSPMAWLHVYVLSFPFVVLLWKWSKDASGKYRPLLLAALAAYYWGTEWFNPTTEKIAAFNWMFFFKPPLMGLLASLLLWGVWSRKK